jgi:hypothetical protein
MLEERGRGRRKGAQDRHHSQELTVEPRGARPHVFEVDKRRAFLAFYTVREVGVVTVITKETTAVARMAPLDPPFVAVLTDMIAIAA